MSRGLIIAAPGSGAGKTTLTLGLLRALSRRGVAVRGAKSGPDYIDPRFHEAACGRPCPNLDAWAMTPDRIRALARRPPAMADTAGTAAGTAGTAGTVAGTAAGTVADTPNGARPPSAPGGLLLIEGAMGLFDGAPPAGKGSSADLARLLNLPVLLVVDSARMAQSVAALVEGFARHDPRLRIAGVILNNIGSPRHEALLRRALAPLGLPVVGALGRLPDLAHPSRHLGLVQAGERADLEAYLERAADAVDAAVDIAALDALATALPPAPAAPGAPPPPARLRAPARRIAIARDRAFAFAYPHMLEDWRRDGAQLAFFSPLADEPPPPCDMVFLPGGYPELHAARLAGAERFRAGMHAAAATAQVYGECGGYMVLGRTLTDARGRAHPMLGLLDLDTSFARPRLHLGYRQLVPLGGPFRGTVLGHEFHYAVSLRESGKALFHARDAEGNELGTTGLRAGRVCGAFAHVIDGA